MSNRIETQRSIRDDLVEVLSRELLGPFDGSDETLFQRPTGRYLVGRLAPAGTAVGPEEDEGSADSGASDDDSETGYASPISMAMNPSSVGLSFTVGPAVRDVEVKADWGTYAERDTEEKTRKGGTRKVWARTQHTAKLLVSVTDSGQLDLDGDVGIQWLVRRLPDNERRAVSLFLINRVQSENPKRPDDSEWVFQPRLIVRHPSGSAVFLSRSLADVLDFEALDFDRRADELLFRDRPEYAVGHGCAAIWDAEGGAGATEVRSVILPIHELARVDPRKSNEPGLDMRLLGGLGADGVPGDRLSGLLSPLAEAYEEWIEGIERQVASLPPDLREQANEHIAGCRLVHERIVEGIQLLGGSGEQSELARKAFCFSNRAMALQLSRSEVALRRRRHEEPIRADEVPTLWYPFQLAFILLNLPPLVDRSHIDRMTCDLLWFPTGGGKTEAYLGLTALVLALRRMRPPTPGLRAEGGVSVLMRYTLRLLTVQQFQRATALLCACEILRIDEGVWGVESFSIGLWVGTKATPNSYSDPNGYWGDGAKEILQKWRDNKPINGGTPAQLLSCPWCGASLGPCQYEADDYERRVKIFCSDDDCDFAPANHRGLDGIPAHTVDEQIYRHVPSLIIATVDKFAQMAWNGRIQSLFGRVERYCSRHGYISTGEEQHPKTRHNANNTRGWPSATIARVSPFEPPDLIIQDELHLISGPLGTLVGLYETAVDGLASVEVEERYPPKVVASTATIRQADEQVGSLFNRSLTIFPPPGLDSTDSWFATEIDPAKEPGRLYLGVFAPGKSVKTALVRVFATLLSRAARLHEQAPLEGDAYMTLVAYFNSLRELGGAVRLAEDDVPGRIGVLSSRSRREFARRVIFERHELTSNKTAEDVPKILSWLDRQFPLGKSPPGEYPVDILFASNMISVGVDIDRLGLMVVNGQPKATAEYIQATSRVGRQTPGLITTVYNWTRPRDISHYERFKSYLTSGLYRHVEPTSITPFSSRARDKGLAGVLTSLIRQGNPMMAPERAARLFDPATDRVRQILKFIAARSAANLDPGEAVQAEGELVGLADRWADMVADSLPYSRRGHATVDSHSRWLIDRQEENERRGAFVAPGSLREIESEVHVYLLRSNGGTV